MIYLFFSLQLLIAICSLGNISAPAVPEPELTSQAPTELTSQASCPLYEEWKECAPHVCQPSCGGGIFHCPNVSVYNNFCHTKFQELIKVSFPYKLVSCHMWTFKTIWSLLKICNLMRNQIFDCMWLQLRLPKKYSSVKKYSSAC